MAIVGLNPAKTMDVPAPPVSRAAGFSAGEQPRVNGGTGANSIALLNVPGLVVKGGAEGYAADTWRRISRRLRKRI